MVKKALLIFGLFAVGVSNGYAADVATLVSAYPGSVEVASTEEDETRIHRLITGAIERVNTQIVPESAEYIQGKKHSVTYEIPDERRTKIVNQFFRDQLAETGQILFECAGRDCGSSNHWANDVFNRAILYGPVEHQHYFLASVNESGITDYLIVYVAQRATGKLYAHIEVISEVVGQALTPELFASALRLQGRYTIPQDATPEKLAIIKAGLVASEFQRFAVVGHDALEADETVESSVQRTGLIAQAMVEMLASADVELSAFGVGPLSPLNRERRMRIEIVVLDQ